MRCSAIYRTTSILSLCALIGCVGSGEDETDYSYGGSSSALSEQYSKSTWGPGGELGTGWVRGFVTEFSMAAVRAVRNTANFTNNVNWRGGRPLEAARVDYARSVGLTGAGQTIAIMDNALRLSHETFDGVNVTHSSVSNLDARDDHGTAVASIAVGRGGTGIDAVEGVASGADLFLGTWDYQTGSTWNERAVMVSEADTAGAIVMNNSWQLSRDFNQSTFEYYFGQYSVASSYISAMRDYAQSGVVVFALSNYHDELDAYNVGALPLLYHDLEGSWITVVNGAATFDEYGITSVERISSACMQTAAFCMTADGSIYIATDYTDIGYTSGTGTSYATPQISGAVALLAEAFPDLSASQLRDRLLASADNGWMTDFTGSIDFGSGVTHAYNDEFGHGFLDLRAALLPIGTASVPVAEGQSINLSAGQVAAVSGALSGNALADALSSETVYASDSLNGTFDIAASDIVAGTVGSLSSIDVAALSAEPRLSARAATAQSLSAGQGYGAMIEAEIAINAYAQTGNYVRDLTLGQTNLRVIEGSNGGAGLGLAHTFATDGGYFSAGLTAMQEVGSVVGVTAPGFEDGIRGRSAALDFAYGVQLADSIGLRLEGAAGKADGHGAGMLGRFNDVTFNSVKVAMDRAMPNGGLLSISLARPAAITSGTVDVSLANETTALAAGSDAFRTMPADLAPEARQMDIGFEYSAPIHAIDNASFTFSMGHSLNAGHIEGAHGNMVGIALNFRL
ncbi:hypothetical protein B9057_04195 [Aestuarium zhoushanense]|nr:hypothetical protein B9057_04195 [Aestuarium zhoushanense]